jgi:hypothetical protein
MQITPTGFAPAALDAGSIRLFAEEVSRTSPVGVVLELQRQASVTLLERALRRGAPADLVDSLLRTNAQAWTLHYGTRGSMTFWRTEARWLLASAEAELIDPIWVTETQSVLDEVAELLVVFLSSGPGATIDYLYTEEADHRPLPNYIEPRPFLKRRYLVFPSGGKLTLHHRMRDATLEGEPVRITEYVVEAHADELTGCGRYVQTVALEPLRLLSTEGPEEVHDVGF